MSLVIPYAKIKSLIATVDVISAMEKAFIQYSNGNSVVPPVGELVFEDPPGDVHIKYGYIKGDEYYVIKIASGFYENYALGIPSGQGLMLVFKQMTGQLEAILLDNGLLTDIRTAAAGALAAKYFRPKESSSVGIIGTGMQARQQLKYLQLVAPSEKVWLWGRNPERVKALSSELKSKFEIHVADSPAELASQTRLIISTTASRQPVLSKEDIQVGTTIIAIGSDTQEKQELDPLILQRADKVISDSLPQSENRGEIFKAISSGDLDRNKVVELGMAIQHRNLQRVDESEIIVVDLTGVAVQDIMISSEVLSKYNQSHCAS